MWIIVRLELKKKKSNYLVEILYFPKKVYIVKLRKRMSERA